MRSTNIYNYKIVIVVFIIIVVYSQNIINCFGQESDIASSVVSEQEPQPSTAGNNQLVTKLFRINNLDLNKAKQQVEQLLTKDAQVKSSVEPIVIPKGKEELRYLAITDTASKVEGIIDILNNLEKDAAPIKLDLNFTNTPLNEVLTTISQSVGINIVGGENFSQPITIHLKGIPVDEVFDIILKSTEFGYFKEGNVYHIVSKKDLPLVSEVFQLEFISAEQVLEAITSALSPNGKVKVFPKFSQAKYSNVLLVTDTQESIERIRPIIKKLDKKVRQVMIEAKFVEVQLNKNDELGIDWVISATMTGASSPTAFPFGRDGKRVLEKPGDLTYSTQEITTGTISFENFQATLHALNTNTKINIISNPRVATREGEESEIVVADKTPIPLYERNKETGQFEISGYQDLNIGVVLKVIPIINSDNTVTLKMNPQVSQATGKAVGPNNERPIVSTREVTTVFTVENGKTVVIGGLIKKRTSNSLSAVPLLGKVPLIGRLFSYSDKEDENSELFIFITPVILDEKNTSNEVDLASSK